MGNPGNIAYGPGVLYAAVLGSTEPGKIEDAWSSAWIQLGYTESGHKRTSTVQRTDLMVAEEMDPVVAGVPTSRITTVVFSLAEITAKNLQRAYNGGTLTAIVGGSTGEVSFTPPEPADETRIMLGWDSQDGTERAIYRRALQVGNLDTERDKGKKALIPVEFKLEKPAGAAIFAHLFAGSRAGT